ncbi:hypothetical protein ACTI_12890 [Actinoplanes sp. OR16]|uniref:hypothetical protein n=1 Tax=Actinoplanes sp. OR16 TaxID=946334 RepID=UPI000F706B0B|nr:hypothetical protein [Actinoplanes sp. OR16]BBH64604.1 hypothetical protein ACTI_12890 [Actinoplanes sp. OR16]
MLIPARYNGPPGTGNGGWCAGVFAQASGLRPAEVTLRIPPPLGVSLSLRDQAIWDGSTLVASLGVGVAGSGVPPVSRAEAVDAARSYPGFTDHPFPTCFVCGPDHPDGLRIFPGVLPDGRTAAPWTVPDEVSEPTMWAALDCPGGWAAIATGRAFVLGRITASIEALPSPGDECVVVGAASEIAGRKASVDSAVYGPGGDRLAVARATWIAV